jgi:hypothetical protein
MENSGRLFEGDVVAPDQFLEIFTKGKSLVPEKELMLAIMSDAGRRGKIKQDLADVRDRLGEPGAVGRAADLVLSAGSAGAEARQES